MGPKTNYDCMQPIGNSRNRCSLVFVQMGLTFRFRYWAFSAMDLTLDAMDLTWGAVDLTWDALWDPALAKAGTWLCQDLAQELAEGRHRQSRGCCS